MKPSALRHPARSAGASLLRLQSDARLAELAVTGHEAAFDAIVDRYRTPLLRYCAGIVGPSRAEDAVQQALINAHDALSRTDEVRHLRSWLYRIAHNASLNVLRAVRDDVSLETAATAGPGARELAAADGAGPAESFERSEQFRATLAAVQALPQRQRAALVLRELEGRSHEEIADALGVTKGSARQHLMRARVAVRSAVTAVTPYPLVARLAELVASGSASPGWVDAAAGAGAGATIAKLTAGLAATGALVGGAVGTQHAVRGGSHGEASPRVAERSAVGAGKRVVASAPVSATSVSLRQGTTAASTTTSSATRRGPAADHAHRDGARHRRKRAHTPTPTSSPTVAPTTTPSVATPEVSHRGRDDQDDDASHGHRRGKHDDPVPKGRVRSDDADTRHGGGHDDKPDRGSSGPPGTSNGKADDNSAPDSSDSGSSRSESSGKSDDNQSSSGSGSGDNRGSTSKGSDSDDDVADESTRTTTTPSASTTAPATTGG